MKQQILDGIAEVLELPEVTPGTKLEESNGWGSLAVVCIIALLDEKAGIEVDGEQLAKCETVGDVLKLAGVE